MFKFLRQWLQKPPALSRVEFCSSCWRSFEVSKPWVEGRNDFKICRDCIFALDQQIHLPVALPRDPTQLVSLSYSENPYRPTQVVNYETFCQMCGLYPKNLSALLYNKAPVCDRCIRISIQLLEELEGDIQRTRL